MCSFSVCVCLCRLGLNCSLWIQLYIELLCSWGSGYWLNNINAAAAAHDDVEFFRVPFVLFLMMLAMLICSSTIYIGFSIAQKNSSELFRYLCLLPALRLRTKRNGTLAFTQVWVKLITSSQLNARIRRIIFYTDFFVGRTRVLRLHTTLA
jgi:hypothetical protein